MSHELPSFLIDAGELLQHVSRVVYRGSPLYYGRSSTNRYDDPAQAYGVLYLARIFHRSRATNEYGIALVCPKIQVSNLDQRAGNAEAKLYRRN